MTTGLTLPTVAGRGPGLFLWAVVVMDDQEVQHLIASLDAEALDK